MEGAVGNNDSLELTMLTVAKSYESGHGASAQRRGPLALFYPLLRRTNIFTHKPEASNLVSRPQPCLAESFRSEPPVTPHISNLQNILENTGMMSKFNPKAASFVPKVTEKMLAKAITAAPKVSTKPSTFRWKPDAHEFVPQTQEQSPGARLTSTFTLNAQALEFVPKLHDNELRAVHFETFVLNPEAAEFTLGADQHMCTNKLESQLDAETPCFVPMGCVCYCVDCIGMSTNAPVTDFLLAEAPESDTSDDVLVTAIAEVNNGLRPITTDPASGNARNSFTVAPQVARERGVFIKKDAAQPSKIIRMGSFPFNKHPGPTTSPYTPSYVAYETMGERNFNNPDMHHFNWMMQPVYEKCDTPSAVSLVVIQGHRKPVHFEDFRDHDCLRLTTVMQNAMRLVDPIIYMGDKDVLYKLRGTRLQEAVTGQVHKYYPGYGLWDPSDYDEDEDVPFHDPVDPMAYNPETTVLNGWHPNNYAKLSSDFWFDCEVKYNQQKKGLDVYNENKEWFNMQWKSSLRIVELVNEQSESSEFKILGAASKKQSGNLEDAVVPLVVPELPVLRSASLDFEDEAFSWADDVNDHVDIVDTSTATPDHGAVVNGDSEHENDHQVAVIDFSEQETPEPAAKDGTKVEEKLESPLKAVELFSPPSCLEAEAADLPDEGKSLTLAIIKDEVSSGEPSPAGSDVVFDQKAREESDSDSLDEDIEANEGFSPVPSPVKNEIVDKVLSSPLYASTPDACEYHLPASPNAPATDGTNTDNVDETCEMYKSGQDNKSELELLALLDLAITDGVEQLPSPEKNLSNRSLSLGAVDFEPIKLNFRTHSRDKSAEVASSGYYTDPDSDDADTIEADLEPSPLRPRRATFPQSMSLFNRNLMDREAQQAVELAPCKKLKAIPKLDLVPDSMKSLVRPFDHMKSTQLATLEEDEADEVSECGSVVRNESEDHAPRVAIQFSQSIDTTLFDSDVAETEDSSHSDKLRVFKPALPLMAIEESPIQSSPTRSALSSPYKRPDAPTPTRAGRKLRFASFAHQYEYDAESEEEIYGDAQADDEVLSGSDSSEQLGADVELPSSPISSEQLGADTELPPSPESIEQLGADVELPSSSDSDDISEHNGDDAGSAQELSPAKSLVHIGSSISEGSTPPATPTHVFTVGGRVHANYASYEGVRLHTPPLRVSVLARATVQEVHQNVFVNAQTAVIEHIDDELPNQIVTEVIEEDEQPPSTPPCNKPLPLSDPPTSTPLTISPHRLSPIPESLIYQPYTEESITLTPALPKFKRTSQGWRRSSWGKIQNKLQKKTANAEFVSGVNGETAKSSSLVKKACNGVKSLFSKQINVLRA